MIVWNILRVAVAAVIIVAVAELSKRFPRYGALLLSLPIISILAFVMSWFQHHDLPAISKLAKETIRVLGVVGLGARTRVAVHRCLVVTRSQQLIRIVNRSGSTDIAAALIAH
jgi:hypothetical protein